MTKSVIPTSIFEALMALMEKVQWSDDPDERAALWKARLAVGDAVADELTRLTRENAELRAKLAPKPLSLQEDL